MNLPKLLGAVFAFVGLTMLSTGSWNLWLAHDSTSWPTVPGQVTSVGVKQTLGRGGSSYRVLVTYQYEVNGQHFVGDRVFYGDNVSLAWSPALQAERERYRRGRTVDVHYDPKTPARAVLEPGLEWHVALVPFMGLIALAAGAFLLMVRIQPKSKASPAA